MRLIDIDALDWEEVEARHGKRNEVVVDCEILIESAPTVNQWIPCSERLPEDKETVLVTVKWFDGFVSIKRDAHFKSGWLSDCNDSKVIAWQPLPEPYRENERWY